MTKAEALKLAIDGKKVRNNVWPENEYIYFNYETSSFLTNYESRAQLLVQPNIYWECYKDSVTKIIVCGLCEMKKQVTGNSQMMCREHATEYLGMKLPTKGPKKEEEPQINVDKDENIMQKERAHTMSSINKDPINPSYYQFKSCDAFDYQVEVCSRVPGDEAAILFNVMKYPTRYRQKGGLEDLDKALWYLQRLRNLVAIKISDGIY